MNLFSEFRSRGLCVIPLTKGVPLVKWSVFQSELPDPALVATWSGKEYGLVCGKVSNIVAIDIDTNDHKTIELINTLAGDSPVKKMGSKGYTAFYRYNGETSHVWKAEGAVICELLSDKRITTIPPSPHRITGIPYTWIGSGSFDDLPELSADFVLFMNAKFPRKEAVFKITAPIQHYENISLSDIEDMLSYISSDCPRDEWIQVGMALRDEFGDAACYLWHSWSAKAPRRYQHSAAQACWRGFNGCGVTVGTIIYLAKQNGYERPSLRESALEVDISYLFKKPIELKAHGLVGEIADWMTRTAWRPQPLLSLSAALVFVGFLKGRKYKTEGNIYPNVYAFNIAGTACGKERPQAAVKYLMERLSAQDKLLNAPASGAGFIDSLASVNGHGMMCIDEMADFITSANNKNSSHQRKVLTYWIETFTSVDTFIGGERRADSSKEKAKRVDNPLFCLVGSTNPNSLKLSLSSESIGNGLLNRFLFFSSNTSPRKRKIRDFDISEQLPEATFEKMKSYLAGIDTIYGAPAAVQKVPFTSEALDMFDSIDDYYEDERQKLDSGNRLRALYGRAHECVGKIALILSDDQRITLKDVQVANEIVSLSVNTAIEFCGDIADGRFEEEYVKCKNIIKDAGEITLSGFVNRTQFLSSKARREEILNSLRDVNAITINQKSTKGRAVTVLWWTGQTSLDL